MHQLVNVKNSWYLEKQDSGDVFLKVMLYSFCMLYAETSGWLLFGLMMIFIRPNSLICIYRIECWWNKCAISQFYDSCICAWLTPNVHLGFQGIQSPKLLPYAHWASSKDRICMCFYSFYVSLRGLISLFTVSFHLLSCEQS